MPSPGEIGYCICCGSQMQAKCGEINTWHWAHISLKNCDSWWEPETEWHYEWKNHFPLVNQEVIHVDDVTGEKHIADVKTKNGIVLEFQNSPITPIEIRNREKFYKNMLWVINGAEFKHHFDLIAKLPSPKSQKVKNCRKEYGNYGQFVVCDVLINGRYKKHLIHAVEKYLNGDNSNLFLFHWNHERKHWKVANKRKFIDFGGEYLYELKKYNDELECVKLWEKYEFIDRALNPN
ncbi:competence protein CoiA [Olivibacter jilunii]|uniref:competence protein CoiA n=1 Tax=Olivibacter jilunii TaxID=985016 RepID=UPI0030FEE401